MKQLEYFMGVCKELHFTRAAEKLGISQPSLSQQIRILEHEMGLPLFDRIGKKTVITEAGHILLKHCYNLFHELDQARLAIGELQGLKRGLLKIGALHSVMNRLLPPAIMAFHRSYPQVELVLSGLRHGEIIDKLLHNELDLGIIYYPVSHEELQMTYLYEERLALVVPKAHALASLREAKLEDLADIPMVSLQQAYYLRQYLDQLFRQNHMVTRIVMELNTFDSLISMVSEGAGAAILPSSYLNQLNQNAIRTIPLAEPSMTVKIGIAHRRNKYLCTASKVFMEQISSTAIAAI
ncbi:DNA-binding transcriptional LysR family regulator [Paenibacillus endophyticus]|uniref:DNA-binding transcriptional LysR family regulator n=1 Tax=Paenibacillus endophyticus TaxID=1294268 RepID=A0A7W5G8J8_9BACL|nr:DNA-binding transcriptional LysR family regulator [Paenibacillus endophyticus]